jgi:DNA-binding FadR family transcriptional regulator
MRACIEPQAAALAAAHGTPEAVAAIEAALGRMVEAESGLDDPLESDIGFHSAILLASENRFFAQLTSFVETALRVSIPRARSQRANADKRSFFALVFKHDLLYDQRPIGSPKVKHEVTLRHP